MHLIQFLTTAIVSLARYYVVYNGYIVKEARKKEKCRGMKTGVSECHKFRICTFFVPSIKDVIRGSNSNDIYVLNDVIFGSFIKYQRID